MTHPEILITESFGSLTYKDEPKYIGKCANPKCKICDDRDIYDDYEYYSDKDGNYFCTKECFEEFYGLTLYRGGRI